MPVKVKRSPAFVKNVTIKKIKTKEALMRRISDMHGVPYKEVQAALRYNIMTVENFAKVTGKTVNNIHQKMRGHVRRQKIHYPLNLCDPFNSLYLKFIYRNAKAEKLIYESANYKYDLAQTPKEDD